MGAHCGGVNCAQEGTTGLIGFWSVVGESRLSRHLENLKRLAFTLGIKIFVMVPKVM